MEPATKDSWDIKPLPEQRARLPLTLSLTPAQFKRVKLGTIPGSMEDRWFGYFEDGWLYLHRSWSGFGIFGVRFEKKGRDHVAAEAWVSREKDQFENNDLDENVRELRQVLKSYFEIAGD